MAGINLIKQLNTKSTGKNSAAPRASLQEILENFREKMSGSMAEMGRNEALGLVKIALGVALIFAVKFFVENSWNAREQVVLEQKIAAAQKSVTDEKGKLGKLQQIIKESEEADKRIGDIKHKLSLVDSVLQNRNVAVKMIDFIVTEMPDSCWLEDIILNPLPSGTVRIKGYALSLQLVSEFIRKLEGAVFFPSWSLVEGREEAASAQSDSSPQFQSSVGTPSSTTSKGKRPAGSKEYVIEAKVVI